MRFKVVSGGVLLTTLIGAMALAEPRDPVAADALFREARALLGEKKYPEACPKLAESFRLDPMPGTLFNLADCEEKQGKLASSLLRWQAFIDMLTASKRLADPRFSVARKKLEELGGRVPRLTLKLREGTPADTVVIRDGVELREASLGVSLPTDAGEHQVLVRSPRRLDRVFKISLEEKENKSLELEAGEPDGSAPAASAAAPVLPAPLASFTPSASSSAPAASPPEPAAPSPRAWMRPAGIAAGAVGVAALVGAGVTGVMLTSRKDTVDKNCDRAARVCSSQEGIDAAESGKTLGPVNLALWIVGALGTGSGAYLFFSAPRESTIQPGVSLSREHSGVWLQGQF